MSDEIHLWLDDERPMPGYYTHHCKTAQEAIDLLKTGKVVSISLDHDLGADSDNTNTGYYVACFIEKETILGRLPEIRTMRVHTANPVGRKNICMALQHVKRYWNETHKKIA